jgi:hypothetical protein
MRVAIVRNLSTSGSAEDPFNEQIESVLKDIPSTWEQYPQDVAGKTAIINMEHNEFRTASTCAAKMHELIHLAAACRYLWEELAHDDK